MDIKNIYRGSYNTDKIISISLFRMKYSYKNELKYYIYLLKFIKNINKLYPKFKILLFIDESVYTNEDGTIFNHGKKTIEKLKTNNKIEIYLYNDIRFKINKYFHDGTFGTLIRFLPLFDYNEYSKYKIVWISDIDLSLNELQDFKKMYNKFKNTTADISIFNNNICYPKEWINNKQIYHIIASFIISKIKLPKYLLINFFNNLNKDKINYKEISKNKKTINKDTRCPYGIDELFLNKYIYKYFQNNKIKIFRINNHNTKGWINKLDYSLNIKILKKDKEQIVKMAKQIYNDNEHLQKKYPLVHRDYLIKCPKNIIKYQSVLNKLTYEFVNF